MTQCTQKKYDTQQSHSILLPKALFPSVLCLPIMLGSVLLIGGCDSSSEYAESSADMESVQSATEEVVNSEMAGIMSDAAVDNASNGLEVANLSSTSEQTLGSQAADIKIAGKALLITASADFKVEDVVKTSDAIESLTRQQAGYVVLSNISNHPRDSRTFVQGNKNITITTYTRQADMTVRIPRANVSKFLAQLQQQVAFLNGQQFSAQDVTLDIYREQLASQLNSDMASELSQERLSSKNDKDQGSNVDAITATYAARRQQELAKLEQLAIADKVQYSTINLTFMQPDISYKETTQNLDVLLDAEQPSFSSQVSQAFKDGWEILRSVALGLIQLWWLLVLGGIFYLIYRMIKAIYRKFFKHDPRIKNMKRELMGENPKSHDSVGIQSSQVEDNSNNMKDADSKDNNHSN
ncbi:DUF4349 domain-containing protein [Psychrobacter sp. Ps4]|uniref:DUF4349 domain-containing protein n=1 Tax=Psychrobacter sp. Ps4 TaxID=2790958 RepID=UPI001EDFAE43|nr:DUF4349 domain-containing protein [Psychrobacter sp. Ps4]MCG3809887.1 DUF4349 domain-containing protein [Psychrobacter sp. Ps4]